MKVEKFIEEDLEQVDVYNINRPDYLSQLETEVTKEFLLFREQLSHSENGYRLVLYWKARRIAFTIPKENYIIKPHDHLVLNLSGYDSWADSQLIDLATDFNPKDWVVKCIPLRSSNSSKTRSLPKELKEVVDAYRDYWAYMGNPDRATLEANRRARLQLFDVDDTGREVSEAKWCEMIARASSGVERVDHEQRAVIIDNILCVNASAAIEYLPEFEEYRRKLTKGTDTGDPRKAGDKLYDACESKSHNFRGHKVFYATADDIIEKTGITIE